MKLKKKKTSPQSEKSGIKTTQTATALAIEGLDAAAMEAADQRRLAPIIERLRVSRAIHDEELLAWGSVEGARWAEQKATSPELQRLERARDPRQDWYFGVGSSAYSDAERFLFIIRPDFDGDRAVAAEFWETVTGDTAVLETGFVQAFAEGAMDLWDQVKDQI